MYAHTASQQSRQPVAANTRTAPAKMIPARPPPSYNLAGMSVFRVKCFKKYNS